TNAMLPRMLSSGIAESSKKATTPTTRLLGPSSCTARHAVSLPANILVADDDEISGRFLKRLLTREGHHVSVVHSGDEALRVCATAPPDLILLDLVARGGHGF